MLAVDPLFAVKVELEFVQLVRAFGSEPGAIARIPEINWRPVFLSLAANRSSYLKEALRFVQLEMPAVFERAVPDRAERIAIYDAAGFTLPPDMPDPVTLWRGGCEPSVEKLRRGTSWTTDRGVACFYAAHWWLAGLPGDPLVIKATLPRAMVLAVVSECERETLLRAPPAAVEVDGTVAEWRVTGLGHAAVMRERRVRLADEGRMPIGQSWGWLNLRAAARPLRLDAA